MITVLIVDDHATFRATARLLLAAEGYDVVGEAETGAAGLAAAAELHPALVLLDVNLPDTDGFAVAERLAELPEPPAVVLTSSRDPRDFGSLVSSCRACGFVPKAELSGAAIEALLHGPRCA